MPVKVHAFPVLRNPISFDEPSKLEDSWLEDLAACKLCGKGQSQNLFYRRSGQIANEHPVEDSFFYINHDSGLQIYGVFDGHDGHHVADYAAQKMPAELLLGQLSHSSSEGEVKEALKSAFHAVDSGYLDSVNDTLAKRADIIMRLPGETDAQKYESLEDFPDIADQIESLNKGISSGASAAVCLIINDSLYVASRPNGKNLRSGVAFLGDSRVLLCKTPDNQSEQHGQLLAVQLTTDHTVDNEDEKLRLQQIGLSDSSLNSFRHTTRCLGDYPRKEGYQDFDVLSCATAKPVIAEPEVIGPFRVNSTFRFLIMLTGGVYKSYVEATGSKQANKDIASMIGTAFLKERTLSNVAQHVVDEIGRLHNETCLSDMAEDSGRASGSSSPLTLRESSSPLFKREDMTLLVRNFNFPLAPQSCFRFSSPSCSNTNLNNGIVDGSGRSLLTQDSDQSGLMSPTVAMKEGASYELDENDRIAPYVSFQGFYDAMEQLMMEQGLQRMVSPTSPP